MRNVRLVLAVLLAVCGVALGVAAPAVAYPAGRIATAQINATRFPAGGTVIVTVEHTTPGPMTMQIFSAPVTIGTGTVGVDGTGTVSGAIPAGYSGPHTIQVTGAGGEIFPFSITVTDGGTGAFGVSCPSATAGAVAVGFDGAGFGAGTSSTLVVNGRPVDTAAASAAGDLRLGADVAVSAGDTLRLSVVTGTSTVASAQFDDVQPCLTFPTPTIPPTGPPTGSATPTVPPSPVGSGTTITVPVGTPPAGTGGRGGDPASTGDLASTGARIGLGVGAGAGLLLAGGLLLLVSRRRGGTARH